MKLADDTLQRIKTNGTKFHYTNFVQCFQGGKNRNYLKILLCFTNEITNN